MRKRKAQTQVFHQMMQTGETSGERRQMEKERFHGGIKIQVQIRIKWNTIGIYFTPNCRHYLNFKQAYVQKERKEILMLSLCCCWFGAAPSVNGVTGDGMGSLLFIDLVFVWGICVF